jgi:ketosteroid isomerase-like protein
MGGDKPLTSTSIALVLAGLMLSGGPAAAAAPYGHDQAIIRSLRAANNRALAARDLDATMRIVGADYVMIGGNSGIERNPAENREAWAAEFARPGYVNYVRTPSSIDVGLRKGVLRAAEAGSWEGLDHLAAGTSRPFGRYFVHWSKGSGQWRVVSETYVTLGCHGPGC